MRNIAINIRTFIIALILAIAVWVSAVTSTDPDEVKTFPNPIPIEIVGQDPGLVITSRLPEQIELTLRAPQSVWEQLNAQEDAVHAALDLTGLSAGEHTLDIKIQINVRPVQIVLANPQTVSVTLESLDSRTLPVDLSINGQPAIGYQAGDPTLDTKAIVISGPKSVVDKASRARILVNVDGARESIDQSIPVQVLDAKNDTIDSLSVNPQSVHVNLPIKQQGGFRDVAVKVIVRGQVASGYRLESISVFPPVVTVYATDPALVDSLPGVVETQPLDLQGAKEQISTRLNLNLPSKVSIVGEQTVLVQAGVSSIESSLTLSGERVELIGLPEGMTANISPATIDVIVSGPLPILDTLTRQDVRVTVDMTGLPEGTHQLVPKVEILVANITVESILPGTVEVVLTPAVTQTPKP